MARAYEPELWELEEELGGLESGLWAEDEAVYEALKGPFPPPRSPVLSGRVPVPRRSLLKPVLNCPTPTRETVSGFSRYSNSVASLLPNEQEKIRNIARLIVRSFQPGCQPILTVRLLGHADRDLQRERREPGFMIRISRERAMAVKQALERFINNRALSSRIAWDVRGAGASQLAAPNPATERERMQNRRIEIWLNGKGAEPDSPAYIRWVQSCLNRALGARLAVTGMLGPETQGAIRSFQQRRGLPVNGIITPQTVAALINVCGFPQVVTTGPAVKMRSDLICTPQRGLQPGPDRWVGNGKDNLQDDVWNTMDRLHMLWSISNADYNTEHPGVVNFVPRGGRIPDTMIPLTIAAINRNFDPTLHPSVVQHFLNLTLSDTVGRNQKNNKSDILSLQVSLRALTSLPSRPGVTPDNKFLTDPDFTTERTAVTALTTATVPDQKIPKTIDGIGQLKNAIAGGRLGWAPIRADEAEHGGDRFGGQTFDFTVSSLSHYSRQKDANGKLTIPERTLVEDFGVSIFLPRGAKPDTNKVHVFFSPGSVTGDSGFNAVLMHGLRGASDTTEWILISIPSPRSNTEGSWRTINSANISDCLERVGRSRAINALRLSAHSRGYSGLRETIQRGLINLSLVERVVILDANYQSIADALRRSRIPANRVIAYDVGTGPLPLAGSRTIPLPAGCMRAIGYSRLIQDAMVTRPLLTIPTAISDQLLPLRSRGSFTTSTTPSAGQDNINKFCNTHAAKINKIVRQELQTLGLLSFIRQNDLARFCDKFLPEIDKFGPGIYSHHLFVAEIAHELTA